MASKGQPAKAAEQISEAAAQVRAHLTELTKPARTELDASLVRIFVEIEIAVQLADIASVLRDMLAGAGGSERSK
jgi:hypothetical protein